MEESLEAEVVKVDPNREIYKTGTLIGFGSHGKVYKGYDRLNGNLLALKFVENNTWKKEVAALEKFDHPNIVKYYCHIPIKAQNSERIEKVCIVTEFIRGQTLHDFIVSNEKINEKGLSEPTVYKIFKQLVEGFSEMQRQNYLHRDIKPANILIEEDTEVVKIIDLGQSNERNLIATKRIGTPLYSSPEVLSEKNITDERIDIWSLGLVLYEMITGKCYFEDWKETNDEEKFKNHLQTVKIKIKYPKNFSPFWTEITKNMLAKNYLDRDFLHAIKLKLSENLPKQIELKEKNFFQDVKINNISCTNVSGNENPLTQTQNEFWYSRTKKYLKFYKRKIDLLIIFRWMLSKYKYPFLSNSHKLLLVFISQSIYIASIDHLLLRLTKTSIKVTENEKFNAEKFEEPYKSKMIECLTSYLDYFEKELERTKREIIENILPQLSRFESKSNSSETQSLVSEKSQKSGTSGNSTSPVHPSELLEQFEKVKKLIFDFKEGINYSKEYYTSIFNSIVFSEDYYQTEETIRKYYYQEDMTIYYLMLIICNLDNIISWGNDYLGDEIRKFQEELKNFNKSEDEVEELMGKIGKYNRKKLNNN